MQSCFYAVMLFVLRHALEVAHGRAFQGLNLDIWPG